MKPLFCQQCRAAGIVATAGGPTCTHGLRTGAAWFPPWWGEVNNPLVLDQERRRRDWLIDNLNQKPLTTPPLGFTP